MVTIAPIKSPRSFPLAAGLLLAIGPVGCSTHRVSITPPVAPHTGPAALINGRPVTWSALQPALAELAGDTILEELALDAALAQNCAARGITITPSLIAAERDLLRDSLDPNPDRAERILAQVRTSRRLGPARFESVLARTAMLRALVGPVEPPAGVIAAAERSRLSATSIVRIIACATEAEASAARTAVVAPPAPADAMRFATVAAERSIDESAARGGAVDPIGDGDASIPAALRAAVSATPPGQVTQVVATGGSFVIAFVESRTPPLERLTPQQQADLQHSVQLRWQRLEMERLARQTMSQLDIVPMDNSLNWSRQQRKPTP